MVIIRVVNINDTSLPVQAHDFDAGMDVYARLYDNLNNGCKKIPLPIKIYNDTDYDIRTCIENKLKILPGERVAIPTGLFVEILPGYEIQVRSRSGLSFKEGLIVLNSPGTIDPQYRGEICVIITNVSKTDRYIKQGDKIAQIVLKQVSYIKWEEVKSVSELSDTVRSSSGFGSSGV